MTLLILQVFVTYASYKFQHMLQKHNPTIIETEFPNAFDDKAMIKLNDINFRFAFSIVGFYDRELKDDPKFVRWIARHYGEKNGEHFENMIGLHKCTKEDFVDFYPIREGAEDEFENETKITEKTGMFCFDEWNDDLRIGGQLGTHDYSAVEFILLPCNYVHAQFGEEDYDREVCIANLEA